MKIGDKVKVVNPLIVNKSLFGDVGKVIGWKKGNFPIRVSIRNFPDYGFKSEELEVIE